MPTSRRAEEAKLMQKVERTVRLQGCIGYSGCLTGHLRLDRWPTV